MDLDQELSRCDKALTLAEVNEQRLRKEVEKEDYERNVPEDVRILNTEKVCKSFLLVG